MSTRLRYSCIVVIIIWDCPQVSFLHLSFFLYSGSVSSGKDQEDNDGDSEVEDLAEADEDESDLDLAWKMLDIARAIVEKQSDDTIEKVDILSALAEVALERGMSFSFLVGFLFIVCRDHYLFFPFWFHNNLCGGFLWKPLICLKRGLCLGYTPCRGHWNFAQWLPESTIYLRTAGWTRQ